MEIAGYPNIVFNEIPIYWYRLYDRNDSAVDRSLQLKLDAEIRAKPVFKPVFLPLHSLIYRRLYLSVRQVYRQTQ